MEIIVGNLINLKLVTQNDANFIVNLRQNKELNKYLSIVSNELEEQRIWLQNYKKREEKKKEFYFIVQTKRNISCGTVRIYQINDRKKECVWGSFILDKNRPEKACYEVIELSLKFAFEFLKMIKVLLEVRKENKKAIYIYEKCGFKRYAKDEINYYYEKIKEEN